MSSRVFTQVQSHGFIFMATGKRSRIQFVLTVVELTDKRFHSAEME